MERDWLFDLYTADIIIDDTYYCGFEANTFLLYSKEVFWFSMTLRHLIEIGRRNKQN